MASSDKHSGRAWIAVDVDGVLTASGFHDGFIPPPCDAGIQVLNLLKLKGFKVLLFTGHMNEDRGELEKNVALVEAWVKQHGMSDLVDRVWPYPKPDVQGFLDDKAVRWRGDPEMSALELQNASNWVDAYKAAEKKGA